MAKGYKKRFLTDDDRKLLKKHGVSALGISDFERTDEAIRKRAQSRGGEGSRERHDGNKVLKRARELLAEASAAYPVKPKRRKSLKSWSLDALLEPLASQPRVSKSVSGRFRDLDHGDEVDETPDLLDMMAFEPGLEGHRPLDLDRFLDQEQDDLEAALAGWVGDRD